MHSDKTEAMVTGTAARQRTEAATGSINLGQVKLTLSHTVRRLGIIIDNTPSFDKQVNRVCKSVSFYL